MHGERTWRDRLQAKWATTVHAARAASASFFDLYRWGRAPRPAAAAPTALPGSMKPRLKGSQAGYCSIATTTSSIAGIDEAPRPAAAAPAATAAALPDEPQQDGAGASSIIAGVDASPAWKPSWPLPHRHHDQQKQHCREKMRLMQASPGRKPS
ncbi:hypothetical protein PF005_g26621 [Phytophthora fragariae]|uniref:Uncharacterized protein n=1 Tax=Phytophthora fragariae TaxID=53985 RepID=A0A6A3VUQ5_9STRA|nr:hypothetical protein PF005_g26621 [Phytophthora fragariae]